MDDNQVLKAKLLQSEAENKRLREQLQQLICLVRKAWTGDHSASIDVAMIVGVAPPTLEVSSASDEIIAVPKSRCINNWFRLAVGLINNEYKEKLTTAKARQLLHFRNREAFIEEQMKQPNYIREPKLGEIQQRTSLLRDLVEKESLKRDELKLKLGVLKTSEFQGAKSKPRAGSAKRTRSSQLTDTAAVDQNLVVRSKTTETSGLEQKSPTAERRPLSKEKHKLRPKSAGCIVSGNVKKEAKKTSGKPRRPESAHVSSEDIGRSKSGVGKGKKGRIEDKLTETESDIAFTVQLLQQRLGIDERGMV